MDEAVDAFGVEGRVEFAVWVGSFDPPTAHPATVSIVTTLQSIAPMTVSGENNDRMT